MPTVYSYKVGQWREKKDREIISMKKDILKMIDAIEMNEMHIKQLNWKINKMKENQNDVYRKS